MTTSSSGAKSTGKGGDSGSGDEQLSDSAAGSLSVKLGLVGAAAAGLFAFLA
jgi:hypothetical protein